MLSSCLLYGSIIGIISTTIYALITGKNNEENYISEDQKKNKKMDYLIIFSIIMLISVIVLYFGNINKNQEIISLKGGYTSKVNNQPPF